MVLSVITPLYKLSKGKNLEYLQLLLQSLATAIRFSSLVADNYQLIFINDCPEENYQAEIADWCSKLNISQVVFLQNAINIGQAASRNIGAKNAKGELLHFIDQDDYINEHFYKSLLQLNTDVRLSVVYAVCDKEAPQLYTSTRYVNSIRKSRRLKDLYLLHIDSIAISPGQYLVASKALMQVGGFPVLTNRGADDYGFLYLLMSQPHCTVSLSEAAFFFYRLHNDQNRKTSSMDLSVEEFFTGYPATSSFHDRSVRFLKIQLPLVNRIFRKLIHLYYYQRIV